MPVEGSLCWASDAERGTEGSSKVWDPSVCGQSIRASQELIGEPAGSQSQGWGLLLVLELERGEGLQKGVLRRFLSCFVLSLACVKSRSNTSSFEAGLRYNAPYICRSPRLHKNNKSSSSSSDSSVVHCFLLIILVSQRATHPWKSSDTDKIHR